MDYISNYTASKETIELTKKILSNAIFNIEEQNKKLQVGVQGQIDEISLKQKNIEDSMIDISVKELRKKYEQEWLTLDEKRKRLNLEKSFKNEINATELIELSEKFIEIIKNPVTYLSLGDPKQIHSLIKIIFGDDLQYAKNKGY